MRQPVYTGQFSRDLKRSQKRGKDIEKLKVVVRLLTTGEFLPAKFKDHALSGDWANYRECHLESDWLLIYRIFGETSEVHFMRTGSHSDLFR